MEILSSILLGWFLTKISVVHLLASIRDADRIVVLRDTVASERGTWDELKHQGYVAEILAKGH